MKRARVKKLRRRAVRKARRVLWRRVLQSLAEHGLVGHVSGIHFFLEPEEWRATYRGRTEAQWGRRGAYGGRKGRRARRVLRDHFGYEVREVEWEVGEARDDELDALAQFADVVLAPEHLTPHQVEVFRLAASREP